LLDIENGKRLQARIEQKGIDRIGQLHDDGLISLYSRVVEDRDANRDIGLAGQESNGVAGRNVIGVDDGGAVVVVKKEAEAVPRVLPWRST